jgi:3-phosphoshikimate 1-carboxyvinyltransferase
VTEMRVAGSRPLRGRIRVPGDKSISHRALLLAALADGTSIIRGLSGGRDVACTRAAMVAMGAEVDGDRLTGGPSRLHEPEHVVDVGNSGTGIRLLAGWASARPWLTVLQGDESIARRPMGRVAEPLRQMGALIDGRDEGKFPPLVVRGGALRGIEHHLAVASGQVKGAILLAGLAAEGVTIVHERVPVRAHTEELLALAGADVEWRDDGPYREVRLRPSALSPFELDVPGDPSAAAFWVVAACVTPGSDVTVEHVYTGRARASFLDVLERMGADVTLERVDDTTAHIRARYGPLRATEVGGDEVAGLIDEIPVLSVAAAVADGVTTFADAEELRVKESDRVATTVGMLDAMGVRAEGRADGLVVAGGQRIQPGAVDAHYDHRIAMSAAIAANLAEGETVIEGWEAVATSYPGFEEELERCAS